MKLLLIILFSLLITPATSQTVIENQIDEFTKNKVIRTTWERLCNSKNIYAHVRASKINDTYYLDLKLMLGGSIFSIKDGQNVMLKTSTDSILIFYVPKYSISCKGCGAINMIGSSGEGIELNLGIDNITAEYLTLIKILKIRVNTTKGFVESDVKEKNQNSISSIFKLII